MTTKRLTYEEFGDLDMVSRALYCVEYGNILDIIPHEDIIVGKYTIQMWDLGNYYAAVKQNNNGIISVIPITLDEITDHIDINEEMFI